MMGSSQKPDCRLYASRKLASVVIKTTVFHLPGTEGLKSLKPVRNLTRSAPKTMPRSLANTAAVNQTGNGS